MAPGSRLQELTAQYMQNPRRYFVPLANAYRQAGELDRAIGICREHLPQQPGHMSGHIVLGRAYFAKGDLDAARDVFMTSVALDDENVIALRHLGEIARTRGATVEARQWFGRLLTADPHDRDVAALLRELDAQAASDGQQQREPEPALAARTPVEPQLSALADPTPPGLRAIVGERTPRPAAEPREAESAAPAPPSSPRPLQTFDLSTLDDDVVDPDPSVAPHDVTPDRGAAAGVDDGPSLVEEQPGLIGFASDDLDSFLPVQPSSDTSDAVAGESVGAESELSSAAQEEAPSSWVRPPVATPLDNSAIDGSTRGPGAERPDEVLTRPGFGALASFASWRSQQERNTPLYGVPPVADAAVEPDAESTEVLDDDVEAFWSGSPDATVTAPEFVTETMAALYASQGFTQQALDVYRQLLSRTPENASLQLRVAELEDEIARTPAPASLQEDADNALQFHDFDASTSPDAAVDLTIAGLFDETPEPAIPNAVLAADFESAWPDPPFAAAEPDDWFAGEEQVDPIIAGDAGADAELFGFDRIDAAGVAARRDTPENLEVASVSSASAVLDAVFGMPVIATADAAAGDILARLAVQMVGRLPKEAPTLPTPEVLELPSPVAATAARSGSPAPLLSFDRFFSGSGSPPRARVDTPRASTGPGVPRAPGATPAPSLSPTFGGVPVVPASDPGAATVWPGFDQFLPDRRRPAPASPSQSAPPAPSPASAPAQAAAPPASRPSVAPQQVSEGEPTGTAAPDAPRSAPSDFHRWLEGLS